MKVSVLYCLHPNDDFDRFKNFIKALLLYPSNCASVFILCKNEGQRSHYEQALIHVKDRGIQVNICQVPSEGFDLGTYRHFILNSQSEIFVLMSSSSRPTTSDWVEKLINPILDNRATITGSMVSAESLKSTFQVDLVLGILKRIHMFSKWYPSNKFHFVALQFIGSFLIPVYFFRKPFYTFKRFWLISNFPNLHLRTTGIAVTKSHFLKTVKSNPKSKIDAFLIESGKHGLSTSSESSKSIPYLVTESHEYRLDREYEKNFRNISASNPLVVDKHFEDFLSASPERKQFLETRTWGYA